MQLLHAILGALILFFGRRLYWLAVGVLGFLMGVQLAAELLAEAQLVVQLLAAVAAGILGATLAVVFQRVAFAIGGFLAGAYLAHGIAISVGSSGRVVMEPLGFRMRLVFTVGHGFLRCGVTIFDPCRVELQNPLRTGRAQLTHPAPDHHLSPKLSIA